MYMYKYTGHPLDQYGNNQNTNYIKLDLYQVL